MKFFKKKQKTQKEALIELYDLCVEIQKPKSKYISDFNHERRLEELIGNLGLLINDYNLLEYEKNLKNESLKPIYTTLLECGMVHKADEFAKKFDI